MSFVVKDHYYKKAKQNNFLARSIYKLEEIDKKYKVLKSGDFALDLGYFPGSWIQYTSQKIGDKGLAIGVDIQEISGALDQYRNVKLFHMDAFSINDLSVLGIDRQFDVVLSDMAPSTTGIKSVDQARSLELVEKVFSILPIFLKAGGNLVVKVFDSQDAQNFLKQEKKRFKSFNYLKPKSTRSISKEFFVIGNNFSA